MHLTTRQPFIAVAAAVLALGATGFAAAGSSTFRSDSRPSVSPPPCKLGHDHGRCDTDGHGFAHANGDGDGLVTGRDHGKGNGGSGGHDSRK